MPNFTQFLRHDHIPVALLLVPM